MKAARKSSKPKAGNPKLGRKGQVLGTALIMGAVLLVFALAMVSMLRDTVKLSIKAHGGTAGTLGADAVVDKAIEVLKQGNDWGALPSLSFTPIPGYKADTVYTDIPNSQYVVQIDSGNLINPPGDSAYERTISVDIYTFPSGYRIPAAQPTPWTLGGSIPVSFVNHRILQAVVKRGAVNASLVSGGSIATNGNFEVYWGNVYDYYVPTGCGSPCTNQTVISLGHNQPLGPGYPAFHTLAGCISSSGSCAGCYGGSGSTNSTVCNITDTGAGTCQLYPNDPDMPPRPVVDLNSLKAKAKAIYVDTTGNNSGESGYFWDTACTSCTNTDSIATSHYGSPDEADHQYTGNNFSISQVEAIQARMRKNLNETSSWVGNDDLVYYVDTQDGAPINTGRSNMVNGSSGSTDFKGFAFRGTFVLLGSYSCNGGQNGPVATYSAPSGSWCPTSVTLKPDINGFLYIGGDITKMNGTAPQIYGSIDLEGAYNANGNAKLYYRGDFNYNLVESGTVAVEQWKEVKAFPTPLP